mgnify:CR=1 FL=1
MPKRLGKFELPSKLTKVEEGATPTYAKFIAEPFEAGYGHTIGNSLRRILLSSLDGAAAPLCSLLLRGGRLVWATDRPRIPETPESAETTDAAAASRVSYWPFQDATFAPSGRSLPSASYRSLARSHCRPAPTRMTPLGSVAAKAAPSRAAISPSFIVYLVRKGKHTGFVI